nr:putative late blight resistance protein homolog R1B-16 isoform X2 [Coffea arabica]
MFGLGKTTLAKKVLKDPRIHVSFPDRAFVKVSQDYSKTKVFQDILRAFIDITQEIKDMEDDQLTKKVEEELKKRTYLIVLDDIWIKEAWEEIQGAFPKQKGSVVLITSRMYDVARCANPSGFHHEPFCLTSKQSKELLLRKAGLKSCDLDPDLEDYVSNIAKKCDGLPLSIVVIGGILQRQPDSIHLWEKVSNGVDDYVAKDERHRGLLRLSYDILPFYLKQCFLYLGVFHEGSEIPAWKIFRLWIAEDFIRPNGNMSLEDIAEDHLEDLVARNLVMVGQRKTNGQIKTCLIHDTLRSFCKDEAVEEHLFQETKVDEATTVNPASGSHRRLSIKPEFLGHMFSQNSLEYVRSFLSFAEEEKPLRPNNVSSICQSFKLLRVLDVKSIIFPSFPTELFFLVLLKYIALYFMSDTLPKGMSNLSKLQTVIFETSSRILKVEDHIWKMLHLSHLHTNSSILLPPSLGKEHQSQSSQGQKLETLCTISSQCCTAEVFQRTPNLKKLGICGEIDRLLEASGGSCLFAGILSYIQRVQNLKLVNEGSNFSLNVLRADSFPTKLTRLTLKNTRLKNEHITTLGNLQFLQVLKLKDTVFQEGKLETRDGGFRRLRVLYIGATNLLNWESSESHFPTLKCLIIRDCSRLKDIPSDLGKIRSLQRIELYDPTPSLLDSATKIEMLKLRETQGFKLEKHFSGGKPNSGMAPGADGKEKATGDILPTAGAITKTTSGMASGADGKEKATGDILPTAGAINKTPSAEIPPPQRAISKQSIAPNVSAQTTVPMKKSEKKGLFNWLKKGKD